VVILVIHLVNLSKLASLVYSMVMTYVPLDLMEIINTSGRGSIMINLTILLYEKSETNSHQYNIQDLVKHIGMKIQQDTTLVEKYKE
jgi:hypothetical protein